MHFSHLGTRSIETRNSWNLFTSRFSHVLSKQEHCANKEKEQTQPPNSMTTITILNPSDENYHFISYYFILFHAHICKYSSKNSSYDIVNKCGLVWSIQNFFSSCTMFLTLHKQIVISRVHYFQFLKHLSHIFCFFLLKFWHKS